MIELEIKLPTDKDKKKSQF